ncbi:hypothetical protein [Pectobacterium brasiliense]|uniref:hypothetical protein n=1 Tax=Pectobacterium brasiliense TaxID=180957 RepID=UPI00196983A2|nr:hypothetical protein [Pectobacterium brasiliense]MBN3228183.1 hypothetical protein [Pectobacterium brasiliense]
MTGETHHGLLFTISKTQVESKSPVFKISQHHKLNAPEHSIADTPENNEVIAKINRLKGLSSRYYSIFRLIGSIFKKYHKDIISIKVWEHYLVYINNSEVTGKRRSLNDMLPLAVLKEKYNYNHTNATVKKSNMLYKTFNGDGSSDVYMGDGLWISPNGDIKDNGR